MIEQELQNQILNQMGFNKSPCVLLDSPKIAIAERFVGNISIAYAFGPVGVRLVSFLRHVNLKHPHALDLIIDLFTEDESFHKELLQFAELIKYAKLNLLNEGIKRLVDGQVYKKWLKKVDSILIKNQKIRVLNKYKLNKLRREKKMQIINLSTIIRKGEELWNSQPNDFQQFIRFNHSYNNEIHEAEEKSSRYQKLGCPGLAKYMLDSVDSFKSHISDNYYGFNRVTMTNACIILAKSLGYEFDTNYQPKAYPIHYFLNNTPKNVIEIVNHLEKFPEIGNHPLFDHYIVIVPSDDYYTTRVLLGERDGKCYFICYWR